MYKRSYFLYIIVFLALTACNSYQSDFSSEELIFLQSKIEGADKKEILALSNQVYFGSPTCSLDLNCPKVCRNLYSLDARQKDCKKLKAQQVYQLEVLYNILLEKDFSGLEKVNVFDLKVFFNVGAEPLFRFFKSLDLFSTKIFLKWISLNWKVAQVFQEENFYLFLKNLGDHPINSLKEPILEDRTFIELAWLKQNDFALLWLQDYFQKNQCLEAEEIELDNCVLAQYCLVSESFKEDVSKEFIDFKFVRSVIKEKGGYKDFKAFCSEFCLSKKEQSYCS